MKRLKNQSNSNQTKEPRSLEPLIFFGSLCNCIFKTMINSYDFLFLNNSIVTTRRGGIWILHVFVGHTKKYKLSYKTIDYKSL